MVDEHLVEQRLAAIRDRLDLGRLYDELPAGRDALLGFCGEIAGLE